jgi:hypothetical protein
VIEWRLAATTLVLVAGCAGDGHPVQHPAAIAADALEELSTAQIDERACSAVPDRSAKRCELELTRSVPCHDCNRPLVVNAPAFVGSPKTQDVWLAYLDQISALMRSQPLVAQVDPNDTETDEQCFVRDHALSSILGRPYLEFARYCWRIFPIDAGASNPGANASVPGQRIKLSVDVSVTPNEGSPYREPDIQEMSNFQRVARDTYSRAIVLTCGKLNGTMKNEICVLP